MRRNKLREKFPESPIAADKDPRNIEVAIRTMPAMTWRISFVSVGAKLMAFVAGG
jgi:hypothetical protein